MHALSAFPVTYDLLPLKKRELGIAPGAFHEE